jgi:hypothetical protein
MSLKIDEDVLCGIVNIIIEHELKTPAYLTILGSGFYDIGMGNPYNKRIYIKNLRSIFEKANPNVLIKAFSDSDLDGDFIGDVIEYIELCFPESSKNTMDNLKNELAEYKNAISRLEEKINKLDDKFNLFTDFIDIIIKNK